MREHESFLSRLEDTLARFTGWLAARGSRADRAGAPGPHARLDALRREIASARRAISDGARADLARVRATLEDLGRDYDVPPHRTGLTRAEAEAFGRHLRTASRLLGDLSNLDSPGWNRANDEYERSWAEVERAFDAQGRPASP